MVNIADIEKVNLKIMTCNLPVRELFDHNKSVNIQILHITFLFMCTKTATGTAQGEGLRGL